MNVHHLELFYYVAKHGGISAAVRKIPYGIQQPAVSGQMGKLERELGQRLFARSPFQLTPAGARLFAHVQPFFEGLETVAAELRGELEPELRIGGAEVALRDHLPVVLKSIRGKFPRMRLSLHTTGFLSEMEAWLRGGQIDLALLPVGPRVPAGLRLQRLARLPLTLQVHPRSPHRKASDLWKRGKISEPLICLPENTQITRGFLRELKRRGVTGIRLIEATSLDLVTRYVANGDGVGLNVAVDPKARIRGVRTLLLPDFLPVTIGALWRGEPTALVRAAVESMQAYAKTRWPDWICG